MNGPQLIRQVRAEFPHLPILYVQNREAGDGIPEGLPDDVPVLAEPFTGEQLLAAIQPLLARRADPLENVP